MKPDDEKKCPVMEALKKFKSDLQSSDVADHIRGVHREALLTLRSLLDVCISQLEPKSKPEAAGGRKVPVQ